MFSFDFKHFFFRAKIIEKSSGELKKKTLFLFFTGQNDNNQSIKSNVKAPAHSFVLSLEIFFFETKKVEEEKKDDGKIACSE